MVSDLVLEQKISQHLNMEAKLLVENMIIEVQKMLNLNSHFNSYNYLIPIEDLRNLIETFLPLEHKFKFLFTRGITQGYNVFEKWNNVRFC